MNEMALLREQAKSLRRLARSLEPTSLRNSLIEIAQRCEALADQYERESSALSVLRRLAVAVSHLPLSLGSADILGMI